MHEHVFLEQDGGTLVVEQVEYALPGGALTNALLIGRDPGSYLCLPRATATGYLWQYYPLLRDRSLLLQLRSVQDRLTAQLQIEGARHVVPLHLTQVKSPTAKAV